MPPDHSGGAIFVLIFSLPGVVFVILRHGKTQPQKHIHFQAHIIGRNFAGASLTQPPFMTNSGTRAGARCAPLLADAGKMVFPPK